MATGLWYVSSRVRLPRIVRAGQGASLASPPDRQSPREFR